ncbi:MAG: transposase [Clostridiaceae bacterium]|jgi:transposase-like protein|nr:transposase [Clostridiaceae bacterium]
MLKYKYVNNSIISYFQAKRFHKNRVCPHCNCSHTVRYGINNGKQRYKCNGCRRTFSDLTNTPIYRTHHPEKWEAFIKCTIKGLSLRAAAREIEVSYVTLFYWRHKLLSALKKIDQNKMRGFFEVENFFMKFSQKGKKQIESNKERMHDKSLKFFQLEKDSVCVVNALDFHKNIYSMAVGTGRMNSQHINDLFSRLINENKSACSRPKSFFALFFKKVNINEVKRSLDSNSAVIKYRVECLEWLSQFNGVATKYLNNYLSLFKFIKSVNFSRVAWFVKKLTASILYINIERTYLSIRQNDNCFDY